MRIAGHDVTMMNVKAPNPPPLFSGLVRHSELSQGAIEPQIVTREVSAMRVAKVNIVAPSPKIGWIS